VADTRLVADVGGTNSRLALFDESRDEFRELSQFTNADFDRFEDVIAHWLGSLGETAPTHACIAAAAPPTGDRVNMVNIGWSFSCRELAARFGFNELAWLNDFQANAHALPHLGAADMQCLQSGGETPNRILATVGPGTGLGGATLRWVDGVPIAGEAEPGHAGLSPGSDLELEIFRRLLPDYGDIYAELLVSGAGLARLHAAIAAINGVPCPALTPPEVSSRALSGEDELCVMALQTFCALLGSVCGDFVLSNGAYGGLYIAGGIVPRMIPFLKDSDFLPRFHNKGAMSQHLAQVPIHVITTAQPGLIGAAHAPLQAR
jgi:glucokinase